MLLCVKWCKKTQFPLIGIAWTMGKHFSHIQHLRPFLLLTFLIFRTNDTSLCISSFLVSSYFPLPLPTITQSEAVLQTLTSICDLGGMIGDQVLLCQWQREVIVH